MNGEELQSYADTLEARLAAGNTIGKAAAAGTVGASPEDPDDYFSGPCTD